MRDSVEVYACEEEGWLFQLLEIWCSPKHAFLGTVIQGKVPLVDY